MTTRTIRDAVHHLVDSLPAGSLLAAQRLLTALKAEEDKLPAFLRDAPLDDEPETNEERAAVAEGYADFAAGRVVSGEELRREFGL